MLVKIISDDEHEYYHIGYK